jgi:hypothetical protein
LAGGGRIVVPQSLLEVEDNQALFHAADTVVGLRTVEFHLTPEKVESLA